METPIGAGSVGWLDRLGLWLTVAVGIAAVLLLAGTYRRVGSAQASIETELTALQKAGEVRQAAIDRLEEATPIDGLAALRAENASLRREIDGLRKRLGDAIHVQSMAEGDFRAKIKALEAACLPKREE